MGTCLELEERLELLRCPFCQKVLFKYSSLTGYIEQKCPRCKEIMKIRK